MEGIIKPDENIQKIYDGILNAVVQISTVLRFHGANKVSSFNKFGEQQLDVDLETDSIIYEELKKTGMVYSALSEEKPFPNLLSEDGQYIVTFDPLDGSSIVDTNFAVGSIFAIWEKEEIKGITGRKIIGSLLAIYGNRLTVLYYNTGSKQVDEMCYQRFDNEKRWVHDRENLRIGEIASLFAPGNLGSVPYHPGYEKTVNNFIKRGCKLRYSGGMAPDIYQIFIKGHGIFMYPNAPPKFQAKLRLLYECAPLAFLAEAAGGKAVTGDGEDVLDVVCTDYEQRCGIIVGSSKDVEEIDEIMVEAYKERVAAEEKKE